MKDINNSAADTTLPKIKKHVKFDTSKGNDSKRDLSKRHEKATSVGSPKVMENTSADNDSLLVEAIPKSSTGVDFRKRSSKPRISNRKKRANFR